jgi:hypothetical protein
VISACDAVGRQQPRFKTIMPGQWMQSVKKQARQRQEQR